MQLLRRRSAFSARGPIPPWWRRPGVLAVVGLLVVGGGLAASDSVVGLFETRHVRETTAAVRQLPLPSGMTAWAPACGLYGMKCAQTDLGSANAVEAVADLVRQTGLELPAARCGDEAPIAPGSTLAGMFRHESHCASTVEVGGSELVVAAWSHLPSASGTGGIDLGRTAVVVEWDALGMEALLRAEPGLPERRFEAVGVTADEIAALPGPLAGATCFGWDEDGCLGWETSFVEDTQGPELIRAWADRLLDANLLPVAFSCEDEEGLSLCGLTAEGGRAEGGLSRVVVRLDLDPVDPSLVRANIFTG